MEVEPTRPKAHYFSRFLGVPKEIGQDVERIIFVQFLLLLLGGFVQDGGLWLSFCIVATLGWWGGAILLVARRRKRLTRFDIQFLRTGFFMVMAAEVPLGFLARHFVHR